MTNRPKPRGAPGRSESLLGETLSASGQRDKTLVATKVYFPVDPDDPDGRGVSRRHIIQSARPASAGCRPTISTCTTCTASTPTCRSTSRCGPSMTSSAPGRCGISARARRCLAVRRGVVGVEGVRAEPFRRGDATLQHD